MFLLLAVLYHMQLVFSEPWTSGIPEKALDRLVSCLMRTIAQLMGFIDERYGRYQYA